MLYTITMIDTSFLDKAFTSVSKATRTYCEENNITVLPLCNNCGIHNVIPNKANNRLGFTKFCSPECSRTAKRYPKELDDYNWLYEQRITLQKSYDEIGLLVGATFPTVKRQCTKLKIPNVRYNESIYSVKLALSSKETLEHLYITERKTIYQIGDALGCSPSFVSVKLDEHGIPTRNPNDYDRPFTKISLGHTEVLEYIQSIYSGEVIVNNRELLGGYELDIVVPEKKLAIEYNGVYSHLYRPDALSDSSRKGRDYHVGKTNKCEELNYNLFHIWSTQWALKPDIVKSMIRNKLGLSTRIYARKCEIRLVDTQVKSLFLNNNHIQGTAPSRINLGLYHNDLLVALMTFSTSRYNKAVAWELVRFCNLAHHNVVGGFSKLLKAFTSKHTGSIVSYADRCFSNGGVYKNNGFELTKVNKPSYYYVKKNSEIMEHRANYMKAKITTPDDLRTEETIMFSLGYSKIYDCGTMTFIL